MSNYHNKRNSEFGSSNDNSDGKRFKIEVPTNNPNSSSRDFTDKRGGFGGRGSGRGGHFRDGNRSSGNNFRDNARDGEGDRRGGYREGGGRGGRGGGRGGFGSGGRGGYKKDYSGNGNRGDNRRGGYNNRNSSFKRDDFQRKKEPTSIVEYFNETDVGINEFVYSNWSGTNAIVKHRFSDFIVNEIDENNDIVTIDNLIMPKNQASELQKIPIESRIEVAKKSLEPLLGEKVTNDLIGFIVNELDKKSKNESSAENKIQDSVQGENEFPVKRQRPEPAKFYVDGITDKESRKDIYEAFKSALQGIITASTKDGKIVIQMKGEGKAIDKRENNLPPSERYCHFVLLKSNRETIDVLKEIARHLRIGDKNLSFAGTKDKRGITFQNFSVFNMPARRLLAVNRLLNNAIIGNVRYSSSQLNLGDLSGNRFEIILREIDPDQKDNVELALKSVIDYGFINYFGLQRFGNSAIGTHKIGLAVLLQDWEQTIELIMKPRPGDRERIATSREIWKETKDARAAYHSLPSNGYAAESSILNFFSKSGQDNDFCGAFLTIPRNLRLIYVHAYQSFIWNTIASERIKRYGSTSVILGDIVSKFKGSKSNVSENSQKDADEDPADVKLGSDESISSELVDIVDNNYSSYMDVEVITESNIHLYTINDVVLPTFGLDVTLPQNDLKSLYTEYLERDGLDLGHIRRHPMKEFQLPGNYRFLIKRPSDLSFEWIDYTKDIDFNPSFGNYKAELYQKQKEYYESINAAKENNSESTSNVNGDDNPLSTESQVNMPNLTLPNDQNDNEEISQASTDPIEIKSELTSDPVVHNPLSPVAPSDQNSSISQSSADLIKSESDGIIVDHGVQPSTELNNNPKESESHIAEDLTPKVALRLKFNLDPSTYATMLIREITHVDTGASTRRNIHVPTTDLSQTKSQ
ncbi:putative pseudouridine synthase [Smittium mucronatum]|uniref:Putative pseudouridine synthase n=1 Tax=Smittium mucronatum TaxID=133383 RepID=A0A1R0H5D1_9FUNG|nr:putative pseudouridine synthase [Smittium mucronatum]